MTLIHFILYIALIKVVKNRYIMIRNTNFSLLNGTSVTLALAGVPTLSDLPQNINIETTVDFYVNYFATDGYGIYKKTF